MVLIGVGIRFCVETQGFAVTFPGYLGKSGQNLNLSGALGSASVRDPHNRAIEMLSFVKCNILLQASVTKLGPKGRTKCEEPQAMIRYDVWNRSKMWLHVYGYIRM